MWPNNCGVEGMIITSLDLLFVLLLTQRIVLCCCIFCCQDTLLTPDHSPQGLFPEAVPQVVCITVEFHNVPVGLLLHCVTISVADRGPSLILSCDSTLQSKESFLRSELCLHQILDKDFEYDTLMFPKTLLEVRVSILKYFVNRWNYLVWRSLLSRTAMSEIYKYAHVLMENPYYNLMNHNILNWSTKT